MPVNAAIPPSASPPSASPHKRSFSTPAVKHPSRLDCPILHKKRGDWYLDVYISPDFPFTAQRSGLSYSAGFRLEKTFKGGFSAMAGLQYSRVNLRSYPNDSLYATMADHFDNIDLPLLIGYEYKNADFTIAIHAGIIYNIHSYPGGPHYDPGVHSYIGHTGTSGYLGLDFIKPLNNQLSLFAEPYFRYQPSARSNSSLMTTQLINTAGAMLGIRYNFKKPGAMKTIITGFLLLILSSCHKENHTGGDHLLGVYTEERIIKIHQAIGIYDSTALSDSLDFVDPPVNTIYRWKISPADASATFSDRYKNGRAAIIFEHSGIYKISADIYDSLGLHLTGHTNTIAITRANDTLFPAQAIQPDDGLTIRTTAVGELGSTITTLQLVLTTVKSYDYGYPYTQFEYTDHSTPGNYSLSFALYSRPPGTPIPLPRHGTKSQAFGTLILDNLTIGVPVNLSITWLGKTYTGTITLLDNRGYTYSWDSSGPIKIL